MSTKLTVPTTLRVAGVLLAAQTLTVFLVGGWFLVGGSEGGGSVIPVAILLVLLGIGMACCAYGVFNARRWSQAPATVLELLVVPIGWQIQGVAAITLLFAAVAVLVLMFLPSSTRRFTANS